MITASVPKSANLVVKVLCLYLQQLIAGFSQHRIMLTYIIESICSPGQLIKCSAYKVIYCIHSHNRFNFFELSLQQEELVIPHRAVGAVLHRTICEHFGSIICNAHKR